MTVDLHLYKPYAEGIKYLLAQSPDTESMVPGVSEAEWEDFGRRKGVKVRALPQRCSTTFGVYCDAPLTSCPIHVSNRP